MSIKSFLVSRFGSVSAMAKVCGVTPSAVSQWNKIPLHHIPDILKAAKEKKFTDITLSTFYPDDAIDTVQKHPLPPKSVKKN